MFKIGFALIMALAAFNFAYAQCRQDNEKVAPFVQGEKWLDTDGNPINAHGAGMLFHDGTYYMYGEYKVGETVLPEWATWNATAPT